MAVPEDLEWVDVDSSMILSLAHDERGLFVRFSNGQVYRYAEVSEEAFQELREADSVGSTFLSDFKSIYDFEKMGRG